MLNAKTALQLSRNALESKEKHKWVTLDELVTEAAEDGKFQVIILNHNIKLNAHDIERLEGLGFGVTRIPPSHSMIGYTISWEA